MPCLKMSYFFTLAVIIGLWASSVTARDCNFRFLGHYHKRFAYPKDSISLECIYYSDCPSIVTVYRTSLSNRSVESSESVESVYWYREGLNYYMRRSHDRSNKLYKAKMFIKNFESKDAANYRCAISEIGNKTNQKFDPFMALFTKDSEHIVEKCFLPSAYNITADHTIYGNGSVAITLSWNATVKQSSNIPYCSGSRRWRVKMQVFQNVQDTPEDGQYNGNADSNGWINVDKREMSFRFTQLIDNKTYYQFLVGNRREKVNVISRHKTFGSSIYYFGTQKAPVIKQRKIFSSKRIVVDEMSSLSVTCTATGNPLPSVSWIKTGSHAITQVQGNGSSALVLDDATTDMSGIYLCIAQNVLVNPPEGKVPKHSVWQVSVTVKEYNSSLDTRCEYANSNSFCRSYLHTQFPIFVNTSENHESEVGNAMTKIKIYADDHKCEDLAKSLLCHAVYPYCDARQPLKPLPRPTCAAACKEFTNGKCSRAARKIKLYHPDLYQKIISRCEASKGGEAPECIPISYEASRRDQVQPVKETGACVRGNGIGYTGTQVHTESKRLCQLWSSQSPHKHPMLPSVYSSELFNAGYSCRNPGGLGERPWCYTNEANVRWEYCDIRPCDTCEVYNGTMCSSVPGYKNAKVYVRRGTDVDGWQDIEAKILHVFGQTRFFNRPTGGCEDILKLLLCHSAFPLCDKNGPKDLCNDHCLLRESLHSICPTVYKVFEKFSELGLSSGYISDFKCESSNATCTGEPLQIPTIGYQVPNPANSTYTCYVNKGINYRGNVSMTLSGATCRDWKSQERIINTNHYPSLMNSKNHCRNPSGLLQKPWCYINSTSWEYCAVSYCTSEEPYDTLPSAPNSGPSTINGADGTMTALVYVFVSLLVMFIIAIAGAVFIIFLLRNKKKSMKEEQCRLGSKVKEVINEEKYVINSNYLQVATATSFVDEENLPDNFVKLFPNQIRYVHQLGQGNFGIVFKGRASGLMPDNEEEIDVAVKTLKDESSSEIRSNFLDEAKLMFSFDHPNILHIYGVCVSEMPYKMVFEYMDEGDLTQYLRSKASSMQRRLFNPFESRSRTESSYSNDPPALSKTQLLYICKQIASGMEYLANRNHVHRDLACRNCLVKSDLTVKIGDFGMSRNLYSKDYYRINGQAILPVRWMSPESLVYGKFSVEGDVWSFGVVMWEVFSFALQPYYGLSNEEVTEAIRHGKVLTRPDNCPSEVYKIMNECWGMEAKSRPSFEELYVELSAMYQSADTDNDTETDTDDFSSGEDDSDAFFPETNSLPEDDIVVST